ncbi:hypothetical protein NDU88_003629 [Pleurodeles waltl]|uniref:Uncharacterized protein n=1 Tax=Pleurodeles waltl TaxID=8319 RepID=A0AAV7REG2_PLEWA|nr:hypothetical protein NDU88_003629 [Pleurodeles waltl]
MVAAWPGGSVHALSEAPFGYLKRSRAATTCKRVPFEVEETHLHEIVYYIQGVYEVTALDDEIARRARSNKKRTAAGKYQPEEPLPLETQTPEMQQREK